MYFLATTPTKAERKIKKAPYYPQGAFIIIAYLQQSFLVQVVFAHFWPFGQLVQVACLALAFAIGALALAINEVVANNIATMLKLNFFMFFEIEY